jgi:hypothetical protein
MYSLDFSESAEMGEAKGGPEAEQPNMIANSDIALQNRRDICFRCVQRFTFSAYQESLNDYPILGWFCKH